MKTLKENEKNQYENLGRSFAKEFGLIPIGFCQALEHYNTELTEALTDILITVYNGEDVKQWINNNWDKYADLVHWEEE